MSNDIAQAEKDIDKAVPELLLHSRQWPWSAEEVGREVGDRLGAEDALSRLARAGLAHRHDEFVFRLEQRSARWSLISRADSCAIERMLGADRWLPPGGALAERKVQARPRRWLAPTMIPAGTRPVQAPMRQNVRQVGPVGSGGARPLHVLRRAFDCPCLAAPRPAP
jgi:hypothetical protein